MGINIVKQNFRYDIVGKIRLGEIKETDSGKEYPSNVPYFVLTDAPDVEKYYGKNPKEINGFFVEDDIDLVVPHWLKLYGAGARDKEGRRIGGALKCYGDGPFADGTPGTAYHVEKRDSATGVVPTRSCLGSDCPDAKDAKGNIVCKWAMQVFIYMPQCTPFGLYQIDTTSKTAIFDFVNMLSTIKKVNRGKISGYPMKIYKKEFLATVPNSNQKKVQYTINVEVDKSFQQKYIDIQTSYNSFNDSNIMSLSSQEMIALPMEDNWPVIDQDKKRNNLAIEASKTKSNDEVIDEILNNVDVINLIHQMEELTGSKLTEKQKKMAVLKKIGESNILDSVITSLQDKINEQLSKIDHNKKNEQVIDSPITTAEMKANPVINNDDGGGIL